MICLQNEVMTDCTIEVVVFGLRDCMDSSGKSE